MSDTTVIESLYGENLEIITELIDSKKAENYLLGNICNRILREVKVEEYTRLMRIEKWGFCDSCIVISDDGALLEGQHRLHAVVRSNTIQQFTVVKGGKKDAQKHMGRGAPRSFADILKLNNLTKSSNYSRVASVVRSMLPQQVRLSDVELEMFYKQHKEVVDFAVGLFVKKVRRVGTGPVIAAIARAAYYIDDKKMFARFVEVLTTGITNGAHESAAITLRDWLNNEKHKTGWVLGREAFLRTQLAIKHFSKGHPIKKTRVPASDLFPLKETKKIPAPRSTKGPGNRLTDILTNSVQAST
jgi:hypothetical protein